VEAVDAAGAPQCELVLLEDNGALRPGVVLPLSGGVVEGVHPTLVHGGAHLAARGVEAVLVIGIGGGLDAAPVHVFGMACSSPMSNPGGGTLGVAEGPRAKYPLLPPLGGCERTGVACSGEGATIRPPDIIQPIPGTEGLAATLQAAEGMGLGVLLEAAR